MDGSPYPRGSRRIQDRGLDIVRDGDVFAADTVTVEDKWRESKGTLLTYRNNFVPASEPCAAENEWSTFRQVRLHVPGSQHTLSHFAVSSPSGHIQGISESPCQVFPVIQRRPLFFHNGGKHEGAQGFCGLVIKNLIS